MFASTIDNCQEKLQEVYQLLYQLFEEDQSSSKWLESISNIAELDSADIEHFEFKMEELSDVQFKDIVVKQQQTNLKLQLYQAAGIAGESLKSYEERMQKLLTLLENKL